MYGGHSNRAAAASAMLIPRARGLALIAAAFLGAGTALCTDLAPIPTDSRQYRDLDWVLLNPPEQSALHVTTRPYLAGDITELLSRMSGSGNSVPAWKKKAILGFYRGGSANDSKSESQSALRTSFSPYNITHFTDTLDPLYRTGIKHELAINHGGKLSLYVRGRLENKGNLDSWYKGRIWKGKLTGYFDYGLLTLRHAGFTVLYGRSFRVWGPGDFDRLLLSNNSPAFDQIAVQFLHKRLMFQTWLTRLGDSEFRSDEALVRYFAGHRLSLKLRRNLEIGLSETVLFARKSAPDWSYLNPFLPYYWEQYNSGKDDNIYMGCDLIWWPFESTRLYGELLIDDFQIDFVSGPHKIGLDIGLSKLGFGAAERLRADLQYTIVRNHVYGQRQPFNTYTNNGVIIGSSIGPDADRIRCRAAYVISDRITASLGGIHIRKGEGAVTDRQDIPLPRDEKFPSGTVEKTWVNYFSLELLCGSSLDVQIEAGHFHIDNYANSARSIDSPYLRINIQYDYQLRFNL